MKSILVIAALIAACNAIDTSRLLNNNDLLISVSDCFETDSINRCLKTKVLAYLDNRSGIRYEESRSFDENTIDEVIFNRIGRILNENEIRVRLPEFLFQKAEISYRSDRGIDVDFPEEPSENGEARGLLKKKLLLPILLLFKLKMKALMPLLLAIVGFKAVKALILSKLAITLVVGFLVYNLIKSKGMAMPVTMTPTEPAPTYGPPSNTYGAPSTPASPPSDSYSPSWDPSSSSGGPYSRVWDPSQLAYSSYYSSQSNIVPSSGYSSVSSGSSPSTSGNSSE